ncbi:MAG: hypothetical protein AB8G15_05505 [Saprospiraceae bacterium]
MENRCNSIKYLSWLLLFLVLTQCQSKEQTPMSWEEETGTVIPTKIEGNFLQYSNYCQIILVGRRADRNDLLCLLVSQEEDIIGTHRLSNNRNKLGIPYEKMSIKQNHLRDGMLEIYISEACRPISGKLVITDFDPENYILSGRFEAKLCTTGQLGRLAEKRLGNGQFHQIKLNYFDRRTKKSN